MSSSRIIRILHLEDSPEDAMLIRRALGAHGIEAEFALARDHQGFSAALAAGEFDLILVDNTMPGFSGLDAIELVSQKRPAAPLICVSGTESDDQALRSLKAGASDYVRKDRPWQLVAAVRRQQEMLRLETRNQGMRRLVAAVQELSLAKDLSAIIAVVRHAARELTGADGATFVLREREFCYYADEEAIAPLWKGQRFPLEACISGWVMLNRQPAVIEDIYADSRIPADAYRPTFVRSLAMVPIRTESPIGAIGNYWAKRRLPRPEEVELLQALANTTAVAMENVQVYAELERRVRERTAQLETANRELEAFSYAVSHDLASPLQIVRSGIDLLLLQGLERFDQRTQRILINLEAAGSRMANLTKDLLRLSQLSKAELRREKLDLSAMAQEVLLRLSAASPERKMETCVRSGLEADGDRGLIRIVLENLLSNAWKYTSRCPVGRIEFNSELQPDGSVAFLVRDNGAGFNLSQAQKLFQPFQRFHSAKEFSGTGVGLATVQRIVQRHGGRIWAAAEVGKGATFFFTLRSEAG